MEKLSEIQIKQLAIEIASGVDWKKVASVMESLDWKHYDSIEYQTHQDLLLKAVSNIECCIKQMYRCNVNELTSGSGGIMVRVEINDDIQPDEPPVFVKVWFELDNWDNYL